MAEQPEDRGFDAAVLMEMVFGQALDPLLVIDPINERILASNLSLANLTGFSREEVGRLSLRSLLRHEQEWQVWKLDSTTQSGSDNFLLRTHQPDRWVPVSLSTTSLPLANGANAVLCRLRDRRDFFDVQRKATRAEAAFRRLLESVSDGVFLARIEPDGRWRIRDLSPRLQELIGRPGTALENFQTREQAIVPEDRPAWYELVARANVGKSGAVEYRISRPNGLLVWVRERVVVTPEDGGPLVLGVLTDISDRKKAEQSALELASERPRSLDGLGRLAGAVAQDFEPLLTSLVGNVQMARLDPELTAGCLARIEEVVARLDSHCKQLALIGGRAVSFEGRVDLASLTRRVAEALAVSRGQRLALDLAEGLPLVGGDESALRALVGELLANAFDALEGGPGDVAVSLRRTPSPQPGRVVLTYPEEAPRRGVWLEVTDSGRGLSEEARRRLFEPYFSTREGRSGLGLAVVLGVVRGLGGGLVVALPEGGGTAFRILLPEAPPSASRLLATIGVKFSGKVLLIDDEAPIRELARRLLGSLGCEVLEAADGESALRLLREHPNVQAILMDWHMPGLAGADLVEAIHHIGSTLPVVVLSGYSEQDIGVHFAALRVAGYLQKPFRLTELVELLKPYLAVERETG